MDVTINLGWGVTDQMIHDNIQENFDMVVHEGDVAYAGTGSEWEIEEIWVTEFS